MNRVCCVGLKKMFTSHQSESGYQIRPFHSPGLMVRQHMGFLAQKQGWRDTAAMAGNSFRGPLLRSTGIVAQLRQYPARAGAALQASAIPRRTTRFAYTCQLAAQTRLSNLYTCRVRPVSPIHEHYNCPRITESASASWRGDTFNLWAHPASHSQTPLPAHRRA